MPDSSPARRLSFPVWSKHPHLGKCASGENQPPVTRSTARRRPAVNQVTAFTYLEICIPNSLRDVWRLPLTHCQIGIFQNPIPASNCPVHCLLHLRRNGAAAFPFQAIRGDGRFGVAMPGISKPILKSSNRKMTGIMTRVQVENIH
ncbi:hypothetical protein QR685DRAFT_594700 [Neurospora intermedia]|uniref:Uncharacterized protein n=1 Tax=Neurospora intermedia TaxID=5142 RepID=A0ABR3DJF4_NEUIN